MIFRSLHYDPEAPVEPASTLRSVAAAFVVCVSSGFTVYVIIAKNCERDAARTGVTWVRRHRTDTVKQGVNMETFSRERSECDGIL